MIMNCVNTSKNSILYAYLDETDQNENDADIKDLYSLATKSRPTKKLVVFGGIHGYNHTGIPVGQENTEASKFSTGDQLNKRFTGINFVYENLAKYSTNGSDVSEENLARIIEQVRNYVNSGDYYVLLAWCFSHVWIENNGL